MQVTGVQEVTMSHITMSMMIVELLDYRAHSLAWQDYAGRQLQLDHCML